MKEQHSTAYGHVLKYTSLFGGVQGLVILIGLVRNKAMAMLLGAGGMGLNALLVSMQNFASQCTNLGLSFGAVPRLSELYEHHDEVRLDYQVRVIRLWSLIAGVLGLLFCILVSPFVNEFSFTWGNHTLHYAMIGVSVAMMAISGGETAILKSTRHLGALAFIQIYTAIGGVLISIPLYYFFYHSGIVPAIVLFTGINTLLTLSYSYRFHAFRWQFERQMLRDGLGMIKLGVAFVIAAAIGGGSEMLIRSFLNVKGTMDDVGLYNAAYMITITYAGMVFSAMETDYFPRLSAVCKNIHETNIAVNKQMEVSLLLLSPMLVALLMLLPVLIPLLFSSEFLPVIGMAQVAVLAMYFKVLTLPVAYITLARGRSLLFLFQETSYFVVLVIAVIFGFTHYGLYGTGVAIVVAHIYDYLMIYAIAYWKYSYRCSGIIGRYAFIQASLGLLAFIVSLLMEGWGYWITEAALTIISTAYSVYILRQKTRLWQSLKRKLHL